MSHTLVREYVWVWPNLREAAPFIGHAGDVGAASCQGAAHCFAGDGVAGNSQEAGNGPRNSVVYARTVVQRGYIEGSGAAGRLL